jgi:hypothetical protein
MRHVMLTKSFTAEQYASALDSWGWLDLSGKTPVLASLFGHADATLVKQRGREC